jgi:hypothetical protein
VVPISGLCAAVCRGTPEDSPALPYVKKRQNLRAHRGKNNPTARGLNLANGTFTSIDRKQNEETLDHTKIKAHFLLFLKSCISSISEIQFFFKSSLCYLSFMEIKDYFPFNP